MSEPRKVNEFLLIIDSSLFIIDRLITLLKEANPAEQVVAATNYNEAIEVLNKTRAGIVLMDIQLPEKNGIDLLKYIVQHFPATNVVVLSNLSSGDYQKLCKSAGAFDLIDKSGDFSRITEVISSIRRSA